MRIKNTLTRRAFLRRALGGLIVAVAAYYLRFKPDIRPDSGAESAHITVTARGDRHKSL